MFRPSFLCVLACSLAAPAFAADAVITLRTDVTVTGTVFRLQDIASIGGIDPTSSQRLAHVEIGIAPRIGHVERVSQRQVEHVIEAHVPEWRGRLTMGGSKAVTVRSEGVAIDRQRVTRMAADALQAAFAGRYEKFEVRQVGEARALTLPPGAQLSVRSVGSEVARRMAVWIDIRIDGHPYATVPVWFSVEAWKSVPVVKNDLPAESVLQASDLTMELRDVALTGKVIEHMADGSSVRLRHALLRGMPIAESALEPISAISRNQAVAVKVVAGSIVIETAGIAQGDARVGDMVKVRNSGSSEVFLATVLEPGVVSVSMR